MSQVNTITYYNALTVNGLSYNIKFITPDAKTKGDPNKVQELFKAILCSQFGVDKIEDLNTRQITETTMKFNPKDGAEINGAPSDAKIRDVFKETFSENDNYKGMKISGDDPTISDAIEDLYNVQTSESVSGTIDPNAATGWGSWLINRAGNLAGKVYNSIPSIRGEDLDKHLQDKKNRELVRKICQEINDNNVSSDSKKYLKEKLIPPLKKEISKEDKRPGANDEVDNIGSKFLYVIDEINKIDSENPIKGTENSGFDEKVYALIREIL